MAYIGVSPSNGVRQKHTYTATASQTSFSGAGAEGISLSYLDSNYVDVYQNGVKLSEADYTSTTGTTVVLATGATVSDMIEIIVYDVFSVADTVSKADGGTFDASVTFAGDIIKSTSGTSNFAAGVNAGNSIASGGNYNTVIGDEAGTALTTGDENVAVGFEALKTEDANGKNTAVGYRSLSTLNAGADSYNTAFGHEAGRDLTTGIRNIYVGGSAGKLSNDADHNVAIGHAALANNLQGDNNVAVGSGTLQAQNTSSSTDTYNTAVGYNAGLSVTSGLSNSIVGGLAGDALNVGGFNVAMGRSALTTDVAGSKSTAIGFGTLRAQTFSGATDTLNTAVGFEAGNDVTSGIQNTLIGGLAGDAITDSDGNTALGYGALSAEQQGNKSTAVGWQALLQANRGSSGDSFNTAVGYNAASGINTGVKNTFIGGGSGSTVTSGDGNTILGAYNGNQDGLDIRTSSNHVILSDGDGNIKVRYEDDNRMIHKWSGSGNTSQFWNTDSNPYGLFIYFSAADPDNRTNYFILAQGDGTDRFKVFSDGDVVNHDNSYGSISDVKLKEQITDASSQWNDIKALTVRKYKMKSDVANGDSDEHWRLGLIAQEVETAGMNGLVKENPDINGETNEDLGTTTKSIKYSVLYMKAVKALQEAMTRIETLEAKVTALEGE